MRTRSLASLVGCLYFVGALGAACGSESDPTPAGTADSGGPPGPGFLPGNEAGPDLTKDSDEDGVPDAVEGTGDSDGDGKPNYLDPINDGPPPAITLVSISTNFNQPIGIDYHEPTNTIVMSVNYITGSPVGFERIELTGAHQPFSTLSGLTDEVKIATARSGNPAGFAVGDLFVGNGVDGQIVRITDNGAKVINPWVDLPGDNNGLMRGSLYVDRTGVFNGDLIAVTTVGEVWRVNINAVPTKIATVPGVHLEGVVVVPNKPARFGPLAGKIIAGGEETHLLYAIAADGTVTPYTLGVDIEDIDVNGGKENFFGVDFGKGTLVGAGAAQWDGMMGDILLTAEHIVAGTSGLSRLKWDGSKVVAEPILLTAQSVLVGQWEHVTFAAAGVAEIPAVVR